MNKYSICCERPYYSKGLCKEHYNQQYYKLRHPGAYQPITERFNEFVDKSGDCWLWKGYLDKKGYGSFKVKGVYQRAHRFSYEMSVGTIPKGMQLDHLCRNRSCVNPSHLEPVTARENTRRGNIVSLERSKLPVGVNPNHNRYMARASINGRPMYAGTFDTPEEAHAAYQTIFKKVA